VKVGDEIMVKVIEIDPLGRVNLSRRAVLTGEDGSSEQRELVGAPAAPRRPQPSQQPPRAQPSGGPNEGRGGGGGGGGRRRRRRRGGGGGGGRPPSNRPGPSLGPGPIRR
jgi:polyribonucleotide nucleotidyltransferase